MTDYREVVDHVHCIEPGPIPRGCFESPGSRPLLDPLSKLRRRPTLQHDGDAGRFQELLTGGARLETLLDVQER